MPTRLKCEEAIKNHFAFVKNIRIYASPNKKLEINVYFEDLNGQFDNSLIPMMKELLPCHLIYNFMPYHQMKDDAIPLEPNLPELVENMALKTTGNMKSYKDVIEKVLSDLMPFDVHIAMPECVIGIETNCYLSKDDLIKYTLYAQEVAPLGCYVSILGR